MMTKTVEKGKPVDSLTAQKALAYACLILADDNLSITADKLIAILTAANISVDAFMPRIYEQAFSDVSKAKDIIASMAGALGGGGATTSAATGEAAREGKSTIFEACHKDLF